MNTKNFTLTVVTILFITINSYSQNNINQGFKLLEDGEFAKAELFFNDYLNENPDHKTATLCYGRAVGLNNNPEKAKAIFDKLLLSDPNNLEYLLNYAESLLWNKEYNIALEKYLYLLENFDKNPIVYLGLANTYSNLKKYKKAIYNYNQGVKLDDKVLGLYIGLAFTYYANNEDKNALETINKGLLVDCLNETLLKLNKDILAKLKPSLHNTNSLTNDSGKNSAKNTNIRVNFPVNTKLTVGSFYENRTTVNVFNTSANQQSLGFYTHYKLNPKIKLNSTINLLNSKGNINYKNVLYKFSVDYKIRHNHSFSLNYQKEFHNFNVQLINAKIAQHHIFANYHTFSSLKIGFYSQYYITNQSDLNKRNLWFNSVYYLAKNKYAFKFGINSLTINFKEEKPELYFSPKKFLVLESFLEFDFNKPNKKHIVKGNLAYGYQFINNNDKQQSFRTELNLGYKIARKINAISFIKYSNLASGNAAGFEFNEIGLKLDYVF